MTTPYLNWGRWVVDCHCGSAFGLFDGLDTAQVTCKACQQMITVDWPGDAAEVSASFGLGWEQSRDAKGRQITQFVGPDTADCSWRPKVSQ